MKCQKCGGVMNYEKFYGSSEEFFGWRCILCGEIVDPVILENRHQKKQSLSITSDEWQSLFGPLGAIWDLSQERGAVQPSDHPPSVIKDRRST